jgi:hypothetical protein
MNKHILLLPFLPLSFHAGRKVDEQIGPRQRTVVRYTEEHLCIFGCAAYYRSMCLDGPKIRLFDIFLFISFGVCVASAYAKVILLLSCSTAQDLGHTHSLFNVPLLGWTR